MQDQGLSAVEQNRKIQYIIAGRVKLPPVVSKEVVAKLSTNKFSRSTCDNDGQSMDSFASNREDDNKEGGEHSKDKGEYAEEEIPCIREVTRANAMLTNNDTAMKEVRLSLPSRCATAVISNRFPPVAGRIIPHALASSLARHTSFLLSSEQR
jgi:hypothetical protein